MKICCRLRMIIQNIWAIGRNYSEHAKELGNDVPEAPLIFLKAGSCIGDETSPLAFPAISEDIHYELELAFQFNEKLELGKLGLAIDFTARDLQSRLKKEGHPWTLAKSFKNACALSRLIPCPANINQLQFQLSVNGILKQKGHATDMIHKPENVADYIKSRFPVMPYDILLTGTPSGVGPVKPGDTLEAEIPGHLKAIWTIGPTLKIL